MAIKESEMALSLSSSSSQPSQVDVHCFQSLKNNANASSLNRDTFYLKLTHLFDSSGLTLIFNVRETLLDLYLVYLEVTTRGGFHQVSQEKKWGEVASALRLEGNIARLSAQVEKLYLQLLYQFEQLYFYRAPTKSSKTTGLHKRKQISSETTEEGGAGLVKEQALLLEPSDGKEKKKRRGMAQGQRSAYQMFLKQECTRLKSCNSTSTGKGILHTAIDSWRNMSPLEKQPYVDEFKKNQEKFKKGMIIDDNGEHKIMQNEKEEKNVAPTSVCNSEYYQVTSQPEPDNNNYTSINNNAAIGLAFNVTEKFPKDSVLLFGL
ncbi:putative high mobility group B protein 11 [Arachis stenosperma]|uniref:putative high mobility group B protein 11 n=1 Tax=Arachis stenosperma TaxID=217475 RepID=UPI0025AC62A5|nr:putative high mobility group B protein 11 [Arachis stenosperma]